MPKVCAICGRGTQSGNKVSHAQNKSRRKFSINLQVKRVEGQKKKVCTRCIKTLSKAQ